MKNLLYVAIMLFCISCKKDNVQYNSEFETSLQKWNSYKASVKNSYSYTAYRFDGRGFVPQYWQTKITVQNGVVIARAYEVHYLDLRGALLESYIEDKTTLNTHTTGAASLTLDEIYTKTKNEWLNADKTKNKVYFETDSRGLLAKCGYSPNDCPDYCFTGIEIKDIQ